ncbi:MAG: cytochrome c family protein [Myxococcota bacterium]|nr:cytochrome c family protein [Myxococcota bacterium]
MNSLTGFARNLARALVLVLWFGLWLGPGVSSALPPGLGDAGAEIEHKFIGARKCKKCHGKELMGDQNGIWQKGPHRSAVATLAKPASLVIARKAGVSAPPSEAPECLVCHATAYGVPTEMIWKPLNPEEGVQCESCHGPGRDYRKKKIMDDLDEARKKGLWDPSAESGICEHCHNESSPTFDPRRYTLPDGSTTGFDYDQALSRIAHPIPEHVKGHYLELREEQKAEEKKAKEGN